MRIVTLLAACAALIGTPAFAENWRSLTTLSDGTVLGVDTDSVQTGNGYAAVDVAFGYASERNGVKAVKNRIFYSCITGSFDTIKSVAYDGSGRVVSTSEKTKMSELVMVPVNKGSPAELIGRVVCSQ